MHIMSMPPRCPSRPIPLPPADGVFVAIDFETADYGPDSACAVGMVRVEAMTVVHRETRLIQPPRPGVLFTHIHGITWEMVKDAARFVDVWNQLCRRSWTGRPLWWPTTPRSTGVSSPPAARPEG